MGRGCLIALLVLAGLAPPARAAEVGAAPLRVCDSAGCHDLEEVRFTAAAGEANELTIEHELAAFTFRDTVPLTAGRGCSALPDGSVECRATSARADLGDGDDRASTSSPRGFAGVALAVDGGHGDDVLSGIGQLAGGPGDDRLTGAHLAGGDGFDALTGTEGSDYLVGGSDTDTLAGGAGDDTLLGDGPRAVPAPDVLDGGAGVDDVSYYGHRSEVRVDLRNPVGGDGDRITGFEAVTGGAGSDVLAGDGGPNRLQGLGGRDSLHARGGDDRLEGGAERDTLRGAAGDDSLAGGAGLDELWGGDGDDALALAGTRRPEWLSCGDGRDAVTRHGLTLLPRSCELVDGNPAYPRRHGDRLTFTLHGAERMRRGRLELRLVGRERRFAVTRFAVGRETLRLQVRLPPEILRLRRLEAPVEVRVFARDEYPYFLPHRLRWVFDLAPPL
jgi:RTX calcium-binding nonapeptide repeat (4 copies)